jgi:hypothetical protein
MESLIRAYATSKKPLVVERLISDIIAEIADVHQLNRDALMETCTTFLTRKTSSSRCEGVMKNGVRCTCPSVQDSAFCRRHLACEETAPAVMSDRPRCIGMTHRKDQCLSDAIPGSEYCKLHKRKHENEERRSLCAYYEEDEDGEPLFCSKNAVSGKWTCTKHSHLERNQVHLYRYPHLFAYKTRQPHEPSNRILELLLENST